jgi:hypothetical protein
MILMFVLGDDTITCHPLGGIMRTPINDLSTAITGEIRDLCSIVDFDATGDDGEMFVHCLSSLLTSPLELNVLVTSYSCVPDVSDPMSIVRIERLVRSYVDTEMTVTFGEINCDSMMYLISDILLTVIDLVYGEICNRNPRKTRGILCDKTVSEINRAVRNGLKIVI